MVDAIPYFTPPEARPPQKIKHVTLERRPRKVLATSDAKKVEGNHLQTPHLLSFPPEN